MKPAKKIFLLGLSIIACITLASFGWFWAADRLEAAANYGIAQAGNDGLTVTCNQQDVKGYPFRIGLHCENISIDQNKNRIGITAGAFRSAAQIYRPDKIVAELDSPMIITSKATNINADWENLQASSQFGLDGLLRASFNADAVKLNISHPALLDQLTFDTQNIQLHFRQNESNLDMALSSDQLKSAANSFAPQIDIQHFQLLATALGKAYILQRPEPEILNDTLKIYRDTDYKIDELSFQFEDGQSLKINGQIRIETNGKINGNLNISATHLEKFTPLLKTIWPNESPAIDQITQLLSNFATQTGPNTKNLELTFQDSAIRAGFIPLGFLPAI